MKILHLLSFLVFSLIITFGIVLGISLSAGKAYAQYTISLSCTANSNGTISWTYSNPSGIANPQSLTIYGQAYNDMYNGASELYSYRYAVSSATLLWTPLFSPDYFTGTFSNGAYNGNPNSGQSVQAQCYSYGYNALVSGNVFLDNGAGSHAGDGVKEADESFYTGGYTIKNTISGTTTTETIPSGISRFDFAAKSGIAFSLQLTAPSGYAITTTPNPYTGTAPKAGILIGIQQVTCGSACDYTSGTANSCVSSAGNKTCVTCQQISGNSGHCAPPACGNKCSTNSDCSQGIDGCNACDATTKKCVVAQQPWFQVEGGDARFDYGFNDPLPSGQFAMYNGNNSTTNGILFSGASPYSTGAVGTGSFSQTASWQVGNNTNPETMAYPQTGRLSVSYESFIDALSNNPGVPQYTLQNSTSDPTYSCSAANCLLNPVASDNQAHNHGVFFINGDLTVSANNTFTSGYYLFLAKGNIMINNKIKVNQGATVIFASQKDIYIGSGVGETSGSYQTTPPCDTTHTHCDLEGIYVADGTIHFVTLANCSVPTRDNQLNIGGSIIGNATGQLGNLAIDNQRDLCPDASGDNVYPSYTIAERPDFYLNFPEVAKQTQRVFQEVAP